MLGFGAVVLFGLFLVSLFGYQQTGRQYSDHYRYTVQNDRPLDIVAARGDELILHFPLENDLGGNWATPGGVELTFDESVAPRVVLQPKERDWGKEITVKGGGFTYKVTGTLVLPSSIAGPETRLLHGKLSGAILYPIDRGYAFQEVSKDFEVPVNLQLMPKSTLLQLWGGTKYHLFAAGTTLIAGLPLPVGAWVVRRSSLGRRRVARDRRMNQPRLWSEAVFRRIWPAIWVAAWTAVMCLVLAIAMDSDPPREVGILNVVVGFVFGCGSLATVYALWKLATKVRGGDAA